MPHRQPFGEMPTQEEFDALEARVAKLEGGKKGSSKPITKGPPADKSDK